MLFGILLFTAGRLTAQSADPGHDPKHDPRLNAVRWTQTSAEYQALTEQAYRLARIQLQQALEDPTWSADEVQLEENDFRTRKPAVILDVDETVLDNSPYNARNILSGKSYTLESWTAWCKEKKARAIPGAKKFILTAKSLGVDVFYITNRRDDVRQATIDNLKALGFPADEDHVLTRNDEQGRGGDKVSRRAMVASKHRILLLIGDNLSDICSGMDSRDYRERNRLAAQKRKYLGSRWIVLPNPVYGAWERALPAGELHLDPAESESKGNSGREAP